MLFLLVMAGDRWIGSMPNRVDLPDARAAVRFAPAEFEARGFRPLRLVGVWKVEIGDPRFGGVSALAVDGGQLLALTDSGTLIAFPKPGEAGSALVRDLPAGPGNPSFKRNRDSEALARDPDGRGWWVAFERWNQLWLYDPGLRQVLERVDLGRHRWRQNRGIEAMVADLGRLVLFPEAGQEWLSLANGTVTSRPFDDNFGSVTDGVRTADGRLLLLTRKPGLGGLAKRLVAAEETASGDWRLMLFAGLGLGATDNVEAIAIEPKAGGKRLWLMTDNDFRARAPTYLVALDMP